MKKLLILLGAMALTVTLATSEGKCGKCDSGKKIEKKCDNGKYDKDKRSGEKCNHGKCDNGKKTGTKCDSSKQAPEKGKCGQGKCG